jgi:hypothetical protein
MVEPYVVTGTGNAEKPAHHLNAELVPMRLNELVRLPRLALGLVHGHGDHLLQQDQMLVLVHEKLVTPEEL